MANHKSAVKRHKQNLKHNARNRAARTRMKNVIKELRQIVQSTDTEQAKETLKLATSTIDKHARKGVIHWKKAARKVSRLTKAVNAMEKEKASQAQA